MTNLQTSTNLPTRIAGTFARRETVDLAAAELAEDDNFQGPAFSERTPAEMTDRCSSCSHYLRR